MEISISKTEALKLENQLCVTFGFCSMREKYNEIIEALPTDIDEVVDTIFIAEGLNPDTADLRLKRKIRDLITKAHHDSFEHRA